MGGPAASGDGRAERASVGPMSPGLLRSQRAWRLAGWPGMYIGTYAYVCRVPRVRASWPARFMRALNALRLASPKTRPRHWPFAARSYPPSRPQRRRMVAGASRQDPVTADACGACRLALAGYCWGRLACEGRPIRPAAISAISARWTRQRPSSCGLGRWPSTPRNCKRRLTLAGVPARLLNALALVKKHMCTLASGLIDADRGRCGGGGPRAENDPAYSCLRRPRLRATRRRAGVVRASSGRRAGVEQASCRLRAGVGQA